jgi:hypothetical protein
MPGSCPWSRHEESLAHRAEVFASMVHVQRDTMQFEEGGQRQVPASEVEGVGLWIFTHGLPHIVQYELPLLFVL